MNTPKDYPERRWDTRRAEDGPGPAHIIAWVVMYGMGVCTGLLVVMMQSC